MILEKNIGSIHKTILQKKFRRHLDVMWIVDFWSSSFFMDLLSCFCENLPVYFNLLRPPKLRFQEFFSPKSALILLISCSFRPNSDFFLRFSHPLQLLIPRQSTKFMKLITAPPPLVIRPPTIQAGASKVLTMDLRYFKLDLRYFKLDLRYFKMHECVRHLLPIILWKCDVIHLKCHLIHNVSLF